MVVHRAKARFVAGLSATVTRKDGHHPIILMQCGPLRYRVDAKRQAAARPFAHHVIVRPTGFYSIAAPEEDPRVEFQVVCDALRNDDARNEMICADVVDTLTEGKGDFGGAMLSPPEGVWGMPADMLKSLPGYNPDVPKNRAEARDIMEKLGYGPDKRLKLTVSTRKRRSCGRMSGLR